MSDVFFGPEETRLHGVIVTSPEPDAAGTIILHPHPQFGGSMRNNVVMALETVFSEAGFTSLRFDFRGVGRSRGTWGEGKGEQEDVRHAINFLAAETSVKAIHIAGYSFGAIVGLAAGVEDERVASLCGVAPPTVMSSFNFLRNTTKPLLVIAGSRDNFCDIHRIKPLVESCHGRLEIIQEADHFFYNCEQALCGSLQRNLPFLTGGHL